jgi:ubiquinone biosynthesis protein Coq4
MMQPVEMQQTLPMDIPNGIRSTTTKVWETLVASRDGNFEKVRALIEE